jgi:hypothetical protein
LGKEVTEDTPLKSIPSADPKEAIDAEVTRIAKGNQSVTGGFDETGVVLDGASDDVNDEERVEV